MKFEWAKKGISIEVSDSVDAHALQEAILYLTKIQAISIHERLLEPTKRNITINIKSGNKMDNSNEQIKEVAPNEVYVIHKPERKLSYADFSFVKSREALNGYPGSFSNTVIEERRKEL